MLGLHACEVTWAVCLEPLAICRRTRVYLAMSGFVEERMVVVGDIGGTSNVARETMVVVKDEGRVKQGNQYVRDDDHYWGILLARKESSLHLV